MAEQQFYKKQKEYISAPTRTVWKGKNILKIPVGKDGEAWGFGYAKAKAIVNYYKQIADFVESLEQEKFSKS